MFKQRNIESLWNMYESLLKKLNDDNINKLIDSKGQRIIETSYSLKTKEPFCGIGGIVEYSLELAKTSNKISKALNYDIDSFSIIKCALLSIVGRIGNLSTSRFIETTSDWHKEKLGQYYEWNEECFKYNLSEMTLYFLQFFDIKLNWDEYTTISQLNTPSIDEYVKNDQSRLTTVLITAREIVLKDEKDKINETFVIPF
jgi:hypothetical protein